MSEIEKNLSLEEFESRLGHRFENREYLQTALTHRSYANEKANGECVADNERLEFLGDAVLDLVMSAMLMRQFPSVDEGALSKKRASLVNEESLASIAIDFKLDGLVLVGRGEARTGGAKKPRILASTLEAVFGAVFLDAGYEKVASAIEGAFQAKIDEIASASIDYRGDFKTRLQERVQELYRATPLYRIESESGPDHDKVFAISVSIGERRLASGRGRSKKAAEQDAARQALELLT